MKFNYIFIAVGIACSSTLALALPLQPDLVTRYASDIQFQTRDFVDFVEVREDDDMMELFEQSDPPVTKATGSKVDSTKDTTTKGTTSGRHSSINKVILIGHLSGEPEVRFTPGASGQSTNNPKSTSGKKF